MSYTYPSETGNSYNGLTPYDPTGKATNTAQISVNTFAGINEMVERKINDRQGVSYYKDANMPNVFDIHPRRLCFSRKFAADNSQLQVLTALNGAGRKGDKVYQIENDYWLVGYAGGDGTKFVGDDPRNSTNETPHVQLAVVTTGPTSIFHSGTQQIRTGDYVYWAFPEDPKGTKVQGQRESTIYPEIRVYCPQWDTEGLEKLAKIVKDIPNLKKKPDLLPIEEGTMRFERAIRTFMALGAFLYEVKNRTSTPDTLKDCFDTFDLSLKKDKNDQKERQMVLLAREILFMEKSATKQGQFLNSEKKNMDRLLKCAIPDIIWSILQMDYDTKRKVFAEALKPAFSGDEFDALFIQ